MCVRIVLLCQVGKGLALSAELLAHKLGVTCVLCFITFLGDDGVRAFNTEVEQKGGIALDQHIGLDDAHHYAVEFRTVDHLKKARADAHTATDTLRELPAETVTFLDMLSAASVADMKKPAKQPKEHMWSERARCHLAVWLQIADSKPDSKTTTSAATSDEPLPEAAGPTPVSATPAVASAGSPAASSPVAAGSEHSTASANESASIVPDVQAASDTDSRAKVRAVWPKVVHMTSDMFEVDRLPSTHSAPL